MAHHWKGIFVLIPPKMESFLSNKSYSRSYQKTQTTSYEVGYRSRDKKIVIFRVFQAWFCPDTHPKFIPFRLRKNESSSRPNESQTKLRVRLTSFDFHLANFKRVSFSFGFRLARLKFFSWTRFIFVWVSFGVAFEIRFINVSVRLTFIWRSVCKSFQKRFIFV